MVFVEPIRDEKQIKGMCNYLKDVNKRDYLLFPLLLNKGGGEV